MEKELLEFEKYRKKYYSKSLLLSVVGVVLIVLGFILFFTLQGVTFILVLAGMIFLAIGQSIKKKVSVKFKEQFVTKMVKEMYPDSFYDMRSGINKGELMEPGFFKAPDRYFTEDLIRASYEEVPFKMSDYTLQERHTTVDSRGHTQTTYSTYAKGRFMIFDFKRELNEVIKVVETRSLGARVNGLEKIDTESIEFNEKFATYTSNPLKAFYILTPQMQLKLLELEKLFKGSIFFAFMNGKMYLAINDSVDTLDLAINKKLDEKSLQIMTSQLNVPAAVIHELKLSSAKYSEGEAI